MQATYRVPEANLDTLKARLAKIARRCRRIQAMKDLGLKRVVGGLGGVYYE